MSYEPLHKEKVLHALEIVMPEIRNAVKEDDSELAAAYLTVVEWAIEALSEIARQEAKHEARSEQ